MSLQSWKSEFYSVPASEVTGDDIALLEHSIKKWRGLQKSNLAKHNLTLFKRCLSDAEENSLEIDGKSCALCTRHYREYLGYLPDCSGCPIGRYKQEKGIPIYEYPCGDEFYAFVNSGHVTPMLDLLVAVKEFVELEEETRK